MSPTTLNEYILNNSIMFEYGLLGTNEIIRILNRIYQPKLSFIDYKLAQYTFFSNYLNT